MSSVRTFTHEKWKSQYRGFHFTHIPEFKESKTIVNLKAKATKLISQRSWVAPPPGYVKVNVDGASSIDGSGISGVGVIIRDEMGGVVAALCKALPLHYPHWLDGAFCYGARCTLGPRDESFQCYIRVWCYLGHPSSFPSPQWWSNGSFDPRHSARKVFFLLLFFPTREKGLQQGCP